MKNVYTVSAELVQSKLCIASWLLTIFSQIKSSTICNYPLCDASRLMTLTESLTYNGCRQTSYLQFPGSTIHCSILNLLFNYTYFNMAIPFPSLTLKSTRTTSYSKKNYLTLFIFCRRSIVSVICSGEQYKIRSSVGKPKLTLHHFFFYYQE